MAQPNRIPDPRLTEQVPPPAGPIPGVDPLAGAPIHPANTQDPRIDPRVTAERTAGAGSGWLVALVVVVLALAAYFMFAPNREATVPAGDAVTTEPVAPAPAPDAVAPPPPADAAPPAPEGAAPAEPAPAPAEPAPAPAPAPAQ